MSNARIDPRTQRTLRALQDGLREVMRTTSPADIDVSALCRAAGVHRTTFYKHFDTVSELAATLLGDLLDKARCSSSRAHEGFSGWLTRLLEHVAADRPTYRHLLSDSGDPALSRLVCAELSAAVQRAVTAAVARGAEIGMDQRALAMAVGFGTYGLVEAVLADEQLDIPATVEGFVALLPGTLGLGLAA
ncbi:TetR/AcrR family transcriptional regulator [Georgenia yuyongxinii]|uniref:TetR/AcrR family transcriptional regulator n=1 Tax=Georgenia yuyongxinii TaxID=2589797 RepID=A0A552WXH3_9MICO|nr:TetR/AcrR family transcriptional regulator [Georgenia yuyongxinii]TRW47538.1 TetR/AcrR family transcriptional regulator [Georgenia yuyongxinii]